MKEFQIEKVNHYTIAIFHNCCIVDYYPITGEIAQFNFTDVFFARENKVEKSVGMWRVKPTDK